MDHVSKEMKPLYNDDCIFLIHLGGKQHKLPFGRNKRYGFKFGLNYQSKIYVSYSAQDGANLIH